MSAREVHFDEDRPFRVFADDEWYGCAYIQLGANRYSVGTLLSALGVENKTVMRVSEEIAVAASGGDES